MRFFVALAAIIATFFFILADAKDSSCRSRAGKKLMEKRGSYSGTGTFFNPSTEGGSTGACGPHESDSAHIVALNAKQYGSLDKKSDWCGKKVKISYKGKTTHAIINDACPECDYGSLDLTHTVFKALEADMDKGVIDIDWSVV
ncbi:RlpA-like double-psi beta-barrel-protein domain-containing protein-containing protein [Chlamydoabsidia padenii]|nr:RlpA-like double-psi beta-barrel-protein domain-containing protein-containing protein [Chlamydoabsidia padenii]